MKYIVYVVIIVSSISCLSCGKPEESTPKAATVTTSFLIPAGAILTTGDRTEVQAWWDEYNEAIN